MTAAKKPMTAQEPRKGTATREMAPNPPHARNGAQTSAESPCGPVLGTASGRQLAAILDVVPAYVTRLKGEGVLHTDGATGRYDVRDSVHAYIRHLRRTRSDRQTQGELDRERLETEKLYWQTQNECTKNEAWRIQWGTELGRAILEGLNAYVENFRHAVRATSPELREAWRILCARLAGMRTRDLEGTVRKVFGAGAPADYLEDAPGATDGRGDLAPEGIGPIEKWRK